MKKIKRFGLKNVLSGWKYVSFWLFCLYCNALYYNYISLFYDVALKTYKGMTSLKKDVIILNKNTPFVGSKIFFIYTL